ncbi:MauE/DoxX family redox-associated membrane protein [Psychrobacter sp. ER1]|uniref:MauE/DoxX family redox-associated membrane protein n=1 Tax=Psychrobacter sp. ER1 TaxID=3406645 RepID=UPI003B42B96F
MKTAVVYRMVKPDHVCPFGLKALDLLERNGYQVEDKHLTNDAETQALKDKLNVKTTPQIFIDGERIGGYDDLQAFFGKEVSESTEMSYTPVIAIFATTALASISLTWGFSSTLFSVQTIIWFVALSMIVLAIQKLQDLESFTNQFLGYDLLARKVVRYAYVYPFAEAFVGIAMLADVAWLSVVASVVAIFIGGINCLSVFKAVYIDKRELKCACVGGNSNVPLGFVSLTENIMMVGMGIYMLIRFSSIL